jgi:hypothetical protein
MRNLSKLAHLLPEPDRLLKALAIPPTGHQEVFPFAVSALQFFYLITGILAGGGLLISMISLGALILKGDLDENLWIKLFWVIMNGLLLLGAVTISVRALRTRAGGASAFYPLLTLTIFQIVIQFSLIFALLGTESSNETTIGKLNSASTGSLLSLFAFPLGLVIIIPILLFRWRDLYRWLPGLQGSTVSRLESLLLLYTPSRPRVLFIHIIFHGLLLLIYAFLVVLNTTNIDWTTLAFSIPFALIAFGVRWWARRASKQ